MTPPCSPETTTPRKATVDTAAETKSKTYKVVIVGAGASGLRCAKSLVADKGYDPADVLVLEARDRIGGRIHSEHLRCRTASSGREVVLPCDHGAAWVHGTSVPWGSPLEDSNAVPSLNPVMQLLQHRGLNPFDSLTLEFKGNPWTRPKTVLKDKLALYIAGRRIETAVTDQALKAHFDTLQAVSDYGNQLYKQGDGMKTTQLSLEDALRLVPSPDPSVSLISRFYVHLIECWHGSSSRELQLSEFISDRAVDDSHYHPVGDFDGPHCTVNRGMEVILKPLLESGIRDRILLNQQVCRIEEGCNHVHLRTTEGLSITAQSCVCTLPVGVLSHAVESGMLRVSSAKREAISSTRMGCYKKVFLVFSEIWWPREAPFLGLIRETESSPLGRYLLINNLWAGRDLPFMEVILFGQAGHWATGKPTTQIRDAVLEFIREATGRTAIEWVDAHVTRWEEDPFSRGAYSSVALGAAVRHVEELSRPEWSGKLVIAGEACVPEFEGSIHSALLSGEQAAEHVHRFLLSCDGIAESERTEVNEPQELLQPA